MANEKLFSAQEAALAVLAKAEELLKASDLGKAEGAPAEKDQSAPAGVKETLAPNKNPDEIKENSNPAPGALPQNTDTYGAEMKGHIKLAKFIGHMEGKRKAKAAPAAPAAAPIPGQESDGKQGG